MKQSSIMYNKEFGLSTKRPALCQVPEREPLNARNFSCNRSVFVIHGRFSSALDNKMTKSGPWIVYDKKVTHDGGKSHCRDQPCDTKNGALSHMISSRLWEELGTRD